METRVGSPSSNCKVKLPQLHAARSGGHDRLPGCRYQRSVGRTSDTVHDARRNFSNVGTKRPDKFVSMGPQTLQVLPFSAMG